MKLPAVSNYPVTWALSIAWVTVFLLMAFSQDEPPASLPSILWGGFIDSDTSHAFGDVTALELYGGQLWRAITATFVHFNVLHLLLNLIGFVQLGRVIESWYGSWQSLAIYAALGLAANLGANLLRPWLGGSETLLIHSGGGSTVVLGQIGLVAVVGWRNPSEFPGKIRFWMVAILVANGLLGLAIPNIDNLGHAAGAVAGGVIGLADRRLLRAVGSKRARVAGTVGLAVLVVSAGMLVGHRRAEATRAERLQLWALTLRDLVQIEQTYRDLARGLHPVVVLPPKSPTLLRQPFLVLPEDPDRVPALRRSLLQALRDLDDRPHGLDRPPTDDDYKIIRLLSSRALVKVPTREEVERFESHLAPLARRTWSAYQNARNDYGRLRYPKPKIAAQALTRPARRSAPPPVDASDAPTAGESPARSRPSNGSDRETP